MSQDLDTSWDDEDEDSHPIIIEAPKLYKKQYEAIFSPARWVYIEASTKAGKTVGCITWQAYQCINRPGEHWWVAPVYGQAEIAFKRACKFLPPEIFTANKSKLRIHFINGSTWHFKSAQNTDNLYGEDVESCVIDEASRCKEGTFIAIRSTLTATRGPCRLIGNVKGRKNFFYLGSRKAEQSMRDKGARSNRAYYKLTAYDAVAGGVLAASEIEDAKESLPEHVFRELYLAEPSDDGSNPFGLQNIEDAKVLGLSNRPVVAYGVDVAETSDWTVIIGLDEYGCVAHFERFQLPWELTENRIELAVGKTYAVMDATGVGKPIWERLSKKCKHLQPFMFSSRSKQQIMESLALAFSHHEIAIPEGVIADELYEFEFVAKRHGFIYSAPEGYHDDCVCALALAEHALRTRSTFKAELGPRIR